MSFRCDMSDARFDVGQNGRRFRPLLLGGRLLGRRSDRSARRSVAKYGVAPEVLMYLNRLSDYFYLLGRTLTEYFSVEETLWIP